MIDTTITAPLALNEQGVIRVAGTRVTLDTVISAFQDGATAEEIVLAYTSLHLADVYATLAWYLQHQAEADTYLRERQQIAEAVRRENEARFDSRGIRERLLKRRAERAHANAQAAA